MTTTPSPLLPKPSPNTNNTDNTNNKNNKNKNNKNNKKKKSKEEIEEENRLKKLEKERQEREIKEMLSKNSGKNDPNKSKTQTSSYYFFKSTDPQLAEKYKPKEVKLNEKPQEISRTHSRGGSKWNTGATMEEYDYSQWTCDELKTRLTGFEIQNISKVSIKIEEVDKCEGTANIIFVRGKLRPGYDLHLKVKYSGHVSDKKIEGTIEINDICDTEDSDEWEFTVRQKKSSSANSKAARIVNQSRMKIVEVIEGVLEEFRNKRN